MPYRSRCLLPDSVKKVLSAQTQDFCQDVFNSARDEYKEKKDRRSNEFHEEAAHKVAWAAVKHACEKATMISGIKSISFPCAAIAAL